jgi:hypothetical protein
MTQKPITKEEVKIALQKLRDANGLVWGIYGDKRNIMSAEQQQIRDNIDYAFELLKSAYSITY